MPSQLRFGLIRFCALLVLATASPSLAQTLSVEKIAFRHDEPLIIRFQHTAGLGNKQIKIFNRFSGTTSSFSHGPKNPERTADRLAGTLEIDLAPYLPYAFVRHTLTPITIQMTEGPPGPGWGPVVAEKFVYILNPVKAAAGSITLPTGPFLPGQEIEIAVSKPRAEAKHLESNWSIRVHQAGIELDGGAILLPQAESNVVNVTSPGQSTVKLKLPNAGGRHEVQVQDEAGFIVDRVTISIEAIPPEVMLSTASAEPPVAGGAFSVLVDGLAFTAPYRSLISDILEPAPRQRWSRAPEAPPKELAPESDAPPSLNERNVELSIPAWSPGVRRLLVSWADDYHSFGNIVAGSLDYSVVPGATGTFQILSGIQMLNNGVFFPGEPVVFEVNELPAGVPTGDEVRIYALPVGQEVPRLDGFRNAEEPVATAPVAGVPSRTEIAGELAPGDYEFVLVSNPSDGSTPRAVSDARMTMLPPADGFSIAVNAGGTVHAYRSYTIDYTIPAPFTPQDGRFTVQIVHLGGTLDDCRIVMERQAFSQRLGPGAGGRIVVDGGASGNDVPLDIPGAYEARLYFGPWPYDPQPIWPRAALVASSRFTVTYKAAPGAVVLETQDPTEADEMFLRLQLPDDLLLSPQASRLDVEVVRQADIADSGVERLSGSSRSDVASPDPRRDDLKNASLNIGKFEAGAYELRVSHSGFCFLGDCRAFLLDRLPFTVRDPAWKGPVALSLARSNIAPERLDRSFARMDPPDSCADMAAERMQLSFARPLDGKPVPLQGPVDYGQPFFVEGRLDAPARRQVYRIVLEAGSAGPQSVLLFPTDDDPTLLRSELTYLMWDIGKFGGASGGVR